jgi:alkanesulfonate monooxygenase SsuD/methylene tetrahydromethanopterin reductase-like flavin-dependent oxidoreductase (luciferase family)
MPSPEEAAAYPYSDIDRDVVADRQASQIIGSPGTVRRGLRDLLSKTKADELMLTTMVFDPADRLHSFELITKAIYHNGIGTPPL